MGTSKRATDRDYGLEVEGSGSDEQNYFVDSLDCVPAAPFSGDDEIHSVCHDVDYNLFHQDTLQEVQSVLPFARRSVYSAPM